MCEHEVEGQPVPSHNLIMIFSVQRNILHYPLFLSHCTNTQADPRLPFINMVYSAFSYVARENIRAM